MGTVGERGYSSQNINQGDTMAQEMIQLFVKPLLEIWTKLTAIIPNILASLTFLLIGLTLARIVTTLAEKSLKKIQLDDYTSKVGINEILARVGFGKSPIFVITFVVYWSIMLVFIILAANVLNLMVITSMLEKFMFFIPKLVVAVIMLFGGLLFARFMHEVIKNSAIANNLKGGVTLAKLVHGVILVFAAMIALEQLGIAMILITSLFQIMIAAFGLAFALAVGLGAKDLVTEYLRNIKNNQQ